MFHWFARLSTWLFVEIIATSILAVLNLIIPVLMSFTSYRNLVNFYFSSTALASALINCLYLFYLIQTIRSKSLSDNNCRAFYYLQTSCIVVLAYTIVAMHASFVLCLFPSSPTSDEQRSIRRCFHSCFVCLRRFFRRFCFCCVLCVWSLSFTSTIPLLYTIDSNEKFPKPVYCPGTTEISYLEEWFDRNRSVQTIAFNLIPLLISLSLSLIALSKLFYDSLLYFYSRWRVSRCFPCRRRAPPSDSLIQPCGRWFTNFFLRFILVLSCCLLACIYPIVMRFYLIYFSVLVPLIFAVFNYSVTMAQPAIVMENPNVDLPTPPRTRENSISMNKILHTNESSKGQFELPAPSIANLFNEPSPSPSSPSTPRRARKNNRRNYFANHLYENIRNLYAR